MKKTPFEKVGGMEVIKKVTKAFYDRVYKDPWISQYFAQIPQEHIENQQADFMSGALNGPRVFSGRMPKDAHVHIIINNELFDLRNKLLQEAMDEVGVSQDMQEVWLRIDESFRAVIVKESGEKRYTNDEILDFSKPKTAA